MAKIIKRDKLGRFVSTKKRIKSKPVKPAKSAKKTIKGKPVKPVKPAKKRKPVKRITITILYREMFRSFNKAMNGYNSITVINRDFSVDSQVNRLRLSGEESADRADVVNRALSIAMRERELKIPVMRTTMIAGEIWFKATGVTRERLSKDKYDEKRRYFGPEGQLHVIRTNFYHNYGSPRQVFLLAMQKIAENVENATHKKIRSWTIFLKWTPA